MVCKDKRKVVVQVKAHIRRVLKCMDKKIAKPLNIADFTMGFHLQKKKNKDTTQKDPTTNTTTETSQKDL